MEHTIAAGEFKARCLALLDEVAQSRTELIVTKHGRPVAKVVPIARPAPTASSVTLVAEDDDDYFSTGESWDADR
ncbi:MAG: type II toxin-antitoxin system Phd/YefM family antitoxin [Sporichthyaceae bacterium]